MTYTNPDQIGEVTEVTGIAKIIRADGSEEPITLGTEIYIGDIVETEGSGAVNIGFVDDSSFAVSEDARISIDEFVFDPASESGDQDFSVVRGVFMYTSGLIGRENPDSVEIETPVGSIGIRGTIIGGKIIPGGESQVSVLEGAIVVRNDGGERLLTNQFDTVLLSSRDLAPSEPKTLDVSRIANDYNGVKSVSSSLFSSFDDQIKQLQNNEGDKQDPAESGAEDKEASAEEAIDETAEDAIVEEVKEAQANQDLKLENLEDLGGALKDVRDSRLKTRVAKRIAERDGETEQVDISVLDRSDKLVVINRVGLDENTDGSGAGIVIGTVVLASGADNVTYSLVNDASGNFSINSATGVLSFVGSDSGDYEAGDMHGIRVRAVNNDTGEVTAKSYAIQLSDTNESAEITSHATILANINENDEGSGLANDTEIANLTFSEVDGNPVHQTAFSTSDARFEVREVGGVLKLVALSGAQFDYETETSISVDITQTDGANSYSTYTVSVSIDDINDESPTNINLTNNSVAENSSISTVVGILSAVDADASGTYTYSITNGNAAGMFTIVGDEIRVNSANLNFEETSSYSLDIEVDDGNGNTYTKNIIVNVDDVNESPTIHSVLEDKFSVTGDIAGVVALNTPGAVIAEIKVHDPDGDVFSVNDFSFTGNLLSNNAGTYFEIIDDGGAFILKLRDGVTMTESGGNFSLTGGAGSISSDTFNVGINVNDGGGNTAFKNITLTAADVTSVTGTVEVDMSLSQDVVSGDASDNIMRLHDDQFKFIKGGSGHDLIRLDGVNGSGSVDVFDMTSMVNNTVGNSADLKSIEEFRFVDNLDKLKLNIQDLKDLLKTAENHEVIFANGSAPNGTGTNDSVNGIYFENSSVNVQLTDHGFTNQGTVNDGGETFVKYTHAELGSVLIEADINGASAGGVI